MKITDLQWVEFTTLYYHPENRTLEFSGMSYGRAFCEHFNIEDPELKSQETQMAQAIDIIRKRYCVAK
jgi:hypothetical protein